MWVSRRLAWALGLTLVVPLGGCDWIRELRAFFHPEEAKGRAGLYVTVKPRQGFKMHLDGRIVAKSSPYRAKNLSPGTHTLVIRAPGYHAFKLPIKLVNGETLKLPVALRKRFTPAAPAPIDADPPPQAAAPPEIVSPKVPPGIEKIRLQVKPTPPLPVRLNGAPQTEVFSLNRIQGKITVGPHLLRYRVGGLDQLFITIPKTDGGWTRDGAPAQPGSSFRLNKGITRLKRNTLDGSLVILMRRR